MNHTETIKTYLEKNPPTTMKEACHKINELTKLKLSVSAIEKYLKYLGLKYRKPGAIPAKADAIKQKQFLEEELKPRLAETKEGNRGLILLMLHILYTSHFLVIFGHLL